MSVKELPESFLIEKNYILREAQTGNIDIIKQFKEDYPDLHWCELRYEKTGDTILHIAARHGFIDIAEYILSNYDPNVVDCGNSDNKTPLHEAAQFAQFDIVKLLLKHGATVNALRRGDWTPLMLACTKISSDDINDNHFKCVEVLLRKGALVNYQNKDGWTAFHLICREGASNIFYLLIENGVDASKLTKNGRSALHIACLHGHLKLVKVLINRLGLDVNLKDSSGNTALHEAVLNGNIDVCKYLLGKHVKTDWKAVNNSGFGLLHLAASIGNKDLILFITETVDIDVNLPSRTNLTPIHCAARKKQTDIVKLLISLGANACFRDNFGRCAADYMDY